MFDRIGLRQILELMAPFVLLVAAGAGLVYAISVAVTLQDLRAQEPVARPDLETWRCAPAAEGEPRPGGAGTPQHPPAAERSAGCPPNGRQVRPQ